MLFLWVNRDGETIRETFKQSGRNLEFPVRFSFMMMEHLNAL